MLSRYFTNSNLFSSFNQSKNNIIQVNTWLALNGGTNKINYIFHFNVNFLNIQFANYANKMTKKLGINN